MELYCDSLQTVTVVGNGPLSDDDRSQINSSMCVIRFNDMKNKRHNENVSLVAIRDNMFHQAPKNIPILAVVTDFSRMLSTDKQMIDESIIIHEPFLQKPGNIIEDKALFPNCHEIHHHSETIHGPSTGTSVIDHLESDQRVERIDVYGMNWNSKHAHVDFKYPHLVPECCSKCVIHPTPSSEYG